MALQEIRIQVESLEAMSASPFVGILTLEELFKDFRQTWFGIPCEALARSREADSDQKFLESLIEEIGVVEEMIQRKVPSVQKTGWRIVGRVALPNRVRKRRGVVQFPWELAEGSGKRLENLASTSFVVKLISQDIDGQIHCRLLPVSGSRCGRLLVRARRTFLDRRPVRSRVVAVQGQYLQLCSSSSSSVV
ncbi:hypothetical protein Taro_003174 [Colocasia esculenta]|uniref:Uncharacterized protein n=1 Tax=Colocasia esculenta TaxID=4460 RepID=A0A843TGB4_COLES|nr:hypothetical protein [Colocasia esculenta]